jgi:hypothetical protein
MENIIIPESSKFICDLCGEEFDSLSDLEEHKLNHLRPAKTEDEDDSDLRQNIGAAGLPGAPVV